MITRTDVQEAARKLRVLAERLDASDTMAALEAEARTLKVILGEVEDMIAKEERLAEHRDGSSSLRGRFPGPI
jgi:cell fate (sporulation/competence/biofilm development) regulator YlbF (YheA/YmcA/DUF963 family)